MKAFVNLKALLSNLERVKNLAKGFQTVCMIKANAYGHGAIKIAQTLEANGVNLFGVATINSAEALRQAGIKSRILLMAGAGLALPEQANRAINANLTPLVSSLKEFEALCQLNKSIKIHIDIDTGLSRGGFLLSQIEKLITAWKSREHSLELEGICTHFSDPTNPDAQATQDQISSFLKAVGQFAEADLKPKVIHTTNSKALVNHLLPTLPGIETWIRPGIALYGALSGFEPIMSLKAPITLLKEIPAGTGVGYFQTWIASRDTKLAIIRAGYGDGYPGILSNKAHVLAHGKKTPIVGRISMDLTMLDVTDIECQVGDWVTLLGREGSEEIRAEDLAKLMQATPNELLTGITSQVERVYVDK
ncbi:MAG: alanine racemase [Deltaproteobacteria bacterium]|nr:alanine racemase [Deltaproteobacteria bacterium]